MIADPGPRARGLIAFVAGAAGAFGHAPWGLWPLTLLGLAGAMALLARATTPRQALVTGWAFGSGYFAVALSWIVEPFLVEPEIHGWMAPFALVFMAGGLALFFAAAFAASFRLGGWLVLTLAAAELARAYVLTGFPWAGFAQVWIGQGLDQSLAWIGPHGLGLLTLGLGWALWRAFDGPLGWGRASAALVLPAAVALGGGTIRDAQAPAPLSDQVVRLVQPNARQDQKWDAELAFSFFARKLDYTAAGPRPDLIVWPETAIPTLLEFADGAIAAIDAVAEGVPVVTGIQRREDLRVFNALIVLRGGPVPDQIYDKHHLVPFGEYMPFGDLAARFGLHGFATREGQGFSAGPGPRAVDLGPVGRALPLICYEAVFPAFARLQGDARPDLLIQITNDAWFGTLSGPYQHLAQARMRAIEQGLPMIRVANTGISAMIDPQGRILGQLALGEAGYLDLALPRSAPATLYARTGDLPVLILICLGLAVVVLGARLRNTD